jgi:hypothetical protein
VGVTSAASALQRRKLIRYRRGDMSVLDVRGLEDAACACYATDKKIYSRILSRKTSSASLDSVRDAGAKRLAAQIAGAISC